jgi:hypothetical protein
MAAGFVQRSRLTRDASIECALGQEGFPCVLESESAELDRACPDSLWLVLCRGAPQPLMRRTARFMCPRPIASKESPVRERNSWNALCSWRCQPW